jgi:stage II sporulation protein GA (sporulation sigma-E factor processing peptidase)
MTGYVVYLDQFFLGNLLMNYLILWSASRLGKARASFFRLSLASGLGGIYSLLTFLPGTGLLFSFPWKLLFSFVMVLVAFAPLSWRNLAACLVLFYISSFILGGMVLGFTYLFHTNTSFLAEIKGIPAVVSRYFWTGVFLALLFGWVSYRAGAWILQRKLTQQRLKIRICFFGRWVDVSALVDTGNSLVDPMTGNPVIVVEYDALKSILPPEMSNSFALDEVRAMATLTGTPWAARLRIIPFQSLGQQQGVIPGIRPDVVEIEKGFKKIAVEKVIVGIYHHRLHSGADYQALLHPALLLEAA